MTKVLGLSGSLRKGSFNTKLLRAAQELAPQGMEIEIATIEGIPVYDNDLETGQGIPEAVATLKARIRKADALLIASPEYNNSLPGALKNAIDWCTRPPKDIDAVFGGKPTGLIGASAGSKGTALAQAAWLPVLRQLHVRYFPDKLVYVGPAGELFDEAGKLTDEKTRGVLERYLAAFAEFIAARR